MENGGLYSFYIVPLIVNPFVLGIEMVSLLEFLTSKCQVLHTESHLLLSLSLSLSQLGWWFMSDLDECQVQVYSFVEMLRLRTKYGPLSLPPECWFFI